MEAKKERKDIVVEYDEGQVWAGKVRVAKWAEGQLKLKGEAFERKERIEELVNERRAEDSMSE